MTLPYINRELSWLEFNLRVLNEAKKETNPPLERLKFLSIFLSNLDEFFMVRVGSLTDQLSIQPPPVENKTNMTAEQQLEAIYKKVRGLYLQKDAVAEQVFRCLEEKGIYFVKPAALSAEGKKELKSHFDQQILPILSPQVVDKKHPFLHFESQASYVVCRLEEKSKQSFGIIPVSPSLSRILTVKDGNRTCYLFVEDVIVKYAARIFRPLKIQNATLARVTRNADIGLTDFAIEDDHDYSDFLQEQLEKRKRLQPVRLEITNDNKEIREFLLEKLELKKSQCYRTKTPMELKFAFGWRPHAKVDASQLVYPPLPHLPLEGYVPTESAIEQILKQDYFLYYPYHTMEPYISLLREAATSPKVISIKITLYRVDRQSRVIEYLRLASENGKEVTVIIELGARFDEENNLYMAKLLRDSGCNVLYGVENYKVHSKITLITLKDEDSLRYITHLGTGNYNEGTSRSYTDANILTASNRIGSDAVLFFKCLAIGNADVHFRNFLVSPNSLKTGMEELILVEIEKARQGLPAQIIAKMNSLTDKDIIDLYYKASQAGVKIQLIVRGICCLRPGLPGISENITVKSIVGRFLEHSRIYSFGAEERSRRIYISSADMMTRNTSRRVEIAAPVLDRKIAAQLYGMLQQMLRDKANSSVMDSQGGYTPLLDGKNASIYSCNSQMSPFSGAYEEYSTREGAQEKPPELESRKKEKK